MCSYDEGSEAPLLEESEASAPGRIWDSSAVCKDVSWASVEVDGSSVDEVEKSSAICDSASLSDMKVSENMTSYCRRSMSCPHSDTNSLPGGMPADRQ